MDRAMKWRVRATRDLLGYVYAHSNHEAWIKARLKWGMNVQTVECMG